MDLVQVVMGGKGGDASGVAPQRLRRRAKLTQVKEDLTCLKSMWFNKVSVKSKWEPSSRSVNSTQTPRCYHLQARSAQALCVF